METQDPSMASVPNRAKVTRQIADCHPDSLIIREIRAHRLNPEDYESYTFDPETLVVTPQELETSVISAIAESLRRNSKR